MTRTDVHHDDLPSDRLEPNHDLRARGNSTRHGCRVDAFVFARVNLGSFRQPDRPAPHHATSRAINHAGHGRPAPCPRATPACQTQANSSRRCHSLSAGKTYTGIPTVFPPGGGASDRSRRHAPARPSASTATLSPLATDLATSQTNTPMPAARQLFRIR